MARKSGSSILQEELYPPSAAPSRERQREREEDARMEMDDARLVDLDAEEESPFLRGQKRVSARRSSLPRKTANRLLWGAATAAAVCVAALFCAGLYHYGEHSWRFRVDSSDNIEVTGTQNVTKAQIMETMGADIGRNIFFIPLAQQKAQLEQIPWVESASVMRFVPNRLKVEILERTPVAFARIGPRMALIDAGGTLMELTPKHKYSFPVILGMNPGEPVSTRASRMKAYAELIRELDAGGARYSQDLSEVDLSDLENLKVQVNDPAGDVLVHLGSGEFLSRYKIYVTHAQGWRQQFQKLDSVDLRYDNQIIVNPDIERGKAAPGVGVAKNGTPGLKPAALLTRVKPGEKAVPKPAFELAQSKLEAKPAGGAGKKNSVKAVGAKSTVKKTASIEKPKSAWVTRKNLAQRKSKAAGRSVRSTEAKATKAKATKAKAVVHSGGSKPSPAIAKAKSEAEPSD